MPTWLGGGSAAGRCPKRRHPESLRAPREVQRTPLSQLCRREVGGPASGTGIRTSAAWVCLHNFSWLPGRAEQAPSPVDSERWEGLCWQLWQRDREITEVSGTILCPSLLLPRRRCCSTEVSSLSPSDSVGGMLICSQVVRTKCTFPHFFVCGGGGEVILFHSSVEEKRM